MLKIKNKFIIFVICLIIAIFLFVLITSYLQRWVDRNSYAILLNWNAKLNDKLLIKDIKTKLVTWDSIITIWDSSLVVLEWWDGSITRLGWNTSLKIDELYVSSDNSEIQIGFKLISWKTWSNVLSFLWEWSYFKEYFRDSEAAVRWTIFNIDLAKEYLVVQSHKLNLTTPDDGVILVEENTPISTLSFDFISLEEFIQKFKDIEWEKINVEIDNQLLNSLRDQLNSDIDNLARIKDFDLEEALLDEDERKQLYSKILSEYQKINFIWSEDNELFWYKLEMKEALLKLADDDNKEKLVNSTLYDFKDILNNRNFESLNNALDILSDNKNFIPEIDFSNFFKNGIIPEDIKEKLQEESEKLQDIFWTTFNDTMLNPLDTLRNLEEKGNDIIHWALDSWYEKIENLINK